MKKVTETPSWSVCFRLTLSTGNATSSAFPFSNVITFSSPFSLNQRIKTNSSQIAKQNVTHSTQTIFLHANTYFMVYFLLFATHYGILRNDTPNFALEAFFASDFELGCAFQ